MDMDGLASSRDSFCFSHANFSNHFETLDCFFPAS